MRRWSTCASSSRSTRSRVPAGRDTRVHRHARGERRRGRCGQRGRRMPRRARHRRPTCTMSAFRTGSSSTARARIVWPWRASTRPDRIDGLPVRDSVRTTREAARRWSRAGILIGSPSFRRGRAAPHGRPGRTPVYWELIRGAGTPDCRAGRWTTEPTPHPQSQHEPQRPVPAPPRHAIEDVQGRADTRQMPINKVGIKDIYHPVRVSDRSGGEQHTVANFNMYVALPHNFKGTHMSRFVEVLHRHEREISVDSFRQMLGGDDAAARRDVRPHRDELPVLRHEEGARLGRRERR